MLDFSKLKNSALWEKIFTKPCLLRTGKVFLFKKWLCKWNFSFTLSLSFSNRNSLKSYSQNDDKLNVVYSLFGVNEELNFTNSLQPTNLNLIPYWYRIFKSPCIFIKHFSSMFYSSPLESNDSKFMREMRCDNTSNVIIFRLYSLLIFLFINARNIY